MIYYSIPYNSKKNLGEYYNAFMAMLPNDDDFACFVDGDAVFTTPYFGLQLEHIIEKYPECGLFTAMTNRVGCKYQLAGEWNNNDMAYHRKMGSRMSNAYYLDVEDISTKQYPDMFSGLLILIRKSVWRDLRGFKEEKMLGIDTDLHVRVSDLARFSTFKFYLMKGVYLYHWYRGGDRNDKEHLV